MTRTRTILTSVSISLALAAGITAAPASAVTDPDRPAIFATITHIPNTNLNEGDSTRITLARQTRAVPVIITWGDNTTPTTLTSKCTPKQARRNLSTCRTTLNHQYTTPGIHTLTVQQGRYTLASLDIHVTSTTPPPPPVVDNGALPENWRDDMLTEINRVRAAAGAAPVTLCTPLDHAAQNYATEMATTNWYGHISRDGSTPSQRIERAGYNYMNAGENIAWGFRTPTAAMNFWTTSPGHYANITNPAFTSVGLGYDYNPTIDMGPTRWVQNFGAGGTC